MLGVIFLILLIVAVGDLPHRQDEHDGHQQGGPAAGRVRAGGPAGARRRTRSRGCSATTAARSAPTPPTRSTRRSCRRRSPTGAGGPGMRPVIADAATSCRVSVLAISIYCPEKLAEFTNYIEDNYKFIEGELMGTDGLREAVTAQLPRIRTDLTELVAHPVGRRRPAVPRRGVRQGRDLGARPVRRGGLQRHAACCTTADGSKAVYGSRPRPTAARADRPALRPLRRAAAAGRRRPGTPRRSS